MRVLVCTLDVDPCPSANIATMAMVDVFDPASLGITSSEILYVFSWGLFAVLSLYFLGYSIGAAVSLIRKT